MLIDKITESEIFFREDLISYLIENRHQHSFLSAWYKECQFHLKRTLENVENYKYLSLGEIGRISFPYFRMGAVTTNNLFGIDELIIMSFYHEKFRSNQNFKLLDLGANLGFHAIAAASTGYIVDAFEPDPTHFKELNRNIKRNHFQKVIKSHEVAVSTKTGLEDFVHVEGNSTSSHLSASIGKTPYGTLKVFSVPTESIKSVTRVGYHLVKMDVEGHEAALLSSLSSKEILKSHWILEVGNHSNALKIFEYIQSCKVTAYSQKCNWERVVKLEDMPSHYSEGSLVISRSRPFIGDSA
jgi:FkbM family methyltransferase